MADGVLGLGQGQAASLNQDLIDKLKAAERKATVEPLETSLTDWETENTQVAGIKTKLTELLAAVRPFDLFVTGGVTAFDQKSANTTGTSVVFNASDVTKLNTGTTNVSISSLATKDVYQSNTFSSKSDILSPINDIVIDGEAFSTTGEDFSALATAIDASGTFTASYDSGANELTINGTVFSTDGKTYSDLATDIETEGTFNASVNYMTIDGEVFSTTGEDFSALATAIDASGTFTASYDSDANELTINGTTFSTSGKSYQEVASAIDAEGTFSTNAQYLKINDDIISTGGKTYQEIADEINAKSSYNASIEEVGTDTFRMVIRSANSGTDNALTITEGGFNLGLNQFTSTASVTGTDVPTTGQSLTIDGTTFTTNGTEDYDTFIARIDADSNFEASISGGKVLIRREDGAALNVTTDDLSLGMTNNNHTLSASNLNAVVDGISYDVSSNELVVDGGLKITAVETGDSSINIQKDTAAVSTLFQDVITKYNELIALVDAEVLSAESKVEDRSVLRTMVSDIKEKLFGSYGTSDDKNLFAFGLSTDKSGVISLDTTVFNTAVSEDLESLESLFIGVAEKEGMGTQLKSYIDGIQGSGGLFTVYEESLTTKKTALEKEKKEAIEDLDNKYTQMSQQFASYNVIINQMEASFSGLKLMIQQSTAK